MIVMKKYMIFAISFILLFSLCQILSGMILTFAYTPDIEEAWNSSASLSQETVIKGSVSPFWPMLLLAFLSASIAYFISNITRRNSPKNERYMESKTK